MRSASCLRPVKRSWSVINGVGALRHRQGPWGLSALGFPPPPALPGRAKTLEECRGARTQTEGLLLERSQAGAAPKKVPAATQHRPSGHPQLSDAQRCGQAPSAPRSPMTKSLPGALGSHRSLSAAGSHGFSFCTTRKTRTPSDICVPSPALLPGGAAGSPGSAGLLQSQQIFGRGGGKGYWRCYQRAAMEGNLAAVSSPVLRAGSKELGAPTGNGDLSQGKRPECPQPQTTALPVPRCGVRVPRGTPGAREGQTHVLMTWPRSYLSVTSDGWL